MTRYGDDGQPLAVRLVALAVEGAQEVGQVKAAEALSAALAVYAEMCGLCPDRFEAFLRNVAAGYRTVLEPRDGERMN